MAGRWRWRDRRPRPRGHLAAVCTWLRVACSTHHACVLTLISRFLSTLALALAVLLRYGAARSTVAAQLSYSAALYSCVP